MNTEIKEEDKIEAEELNAWNYLSDRLLDILNGEYDLTQAREDIKSFRNTEYYTGTNDKYKAIINH